MIKYQYPYELIRKLFRVKSRKTNEVPHECYDDSLPTKEPNAITALKITDRLSFLKTN